jgi:hypothetical protein
VRRLFAFALVFALVVSGAAIAARGDPQKKINPADQARAKSMLLRKADLPPGFRATPPDTSEDDFYCRALDESDLTLTGDAESPDFAPRKPDFRQGLLFVSSLGQVYESVSDANTSWRRGTSPAGEKCLRDGFRREVQKTGDRFVSFRRVASPRVAQRAVAYRLVVRTQGVPFHLELVVLMQSRAHAAIVVGVVPIQSPKAVLDRLAGIVAARMKTAMRGA